MGQGGVGPPHVLVDALDEGGPEAEEDAHGVGEEEGIPLRLPERVAQQHERQVPVGVCVEAPADEAVRPPGREVLATGEGEGGEHAERDVVTVARHELVPRRPRRHRSAAEKRGRERTAGTGRAESQCVLTKIYFFILFRRVKETKTTNTRVFLSRSSGSDQAIDRSMW